jgi:hypothetical protein
MFRSHRGGMLAALIVLALLTVAACGSENGSQGNQSGGKDTAGADGSTEPAQSATMAEKTENGEQKDGGKKGGVTTAQTATGAMKVRDGTFRVDQADTVEFQVSNDALDLRDVSPSSGWRQQTAAQSSDDIEVHFLKGNVYWKFEIDSNSMDISKEQDISQAKGGAYKVGDAGEVRIRSDGGSSRLPPFNYPREVRGWEG